MEPRQKKRAGDPAQASFQADPGNGVSVVRRPRAGDNVTPLPGEAGLRNAVKLAQTA
jgi:hypothetical protein